MTAIPVVPRVREWWVRPRVVLPLLLSLLVLVVLLTPESSGGRVGDDRLSSHLSGSLGARAFKETAVRFGWRVVLRDATPVPTGAPGTRVHAVLAPSLRVTPAQAHRYLDAVRGGDALLLVLGDRGPLSDSLGIWRSATGGELFVQRADSAGCRARGRDFTPSLWVDGRATLYGLRWVRGRPAGAVTFAHVRGPRGVRDKRPTSNWEETAAGFTLGKGRVVVVADPDQLRNDVLRRCEWGADVVAVAMLEWLRAGGDLPRTTLEFDEFHQGYGPKSSPMSVMLRFLGQHPVGRTILQLILAALVLLLAVAPRAILPRPRPRAERRDPLEQADALAHAYQQVRATRTATERMLRGVRARIERAGGMGRTRTDDDFLTTAQDTDPARAADVALVRRALRTTGDKEQLDEIGAALRRIEDSLTITTSTRA